MSDYLTSLPEAEHLQRAADVLKTVAHPARLRIIDFLEHGERAVTEICKHLGLPQPYASQHLNIMKSRQILASRRDGTLVYYSVLNPNVIKVIHCVRQHGGAGGQEGVSSATVASDGD